MRNAVNTWALYFDGSDVGISTTPRRRRSTASGSIPSPTRSTSPTLDNFTVTGLSGVGADVFVCVPGTLGSTTTCTYTPYSVGAANGFTGRSRTAFTSRVSDPECAREPGLDGAATSPP